jgi:hypothetical protein
LDANDDVFEEGIYQFEKPFAVGLDVLVNKHLSLKVQHANVHFPCTQVDPAIILVLLIVEINVQPPFS